MAQENLLCSIKVSIHAPGKGATERPSPKGATNTEQANNSAMTSFNPRAREGRDLHKEKKHVTLTSVSIHAPGKGATKNRIIIQRNRIGFNPRAREGRDVAI